MQTVAITIAAYVVLLTVLQFLGAFVPGDHDLWVVDLDLALKCGTLVFSCGLVTDVLQDRDRLQGKRGYQEIF